MIEEMKGTTHPLNILRNLLPITAVLLLVAILFVGVTGAADPTNGEIIYLDATQNPETYSGYYYPITNGNIPDTDSDADSITWSDGWYYVTAGTSTNPNEVTITQALNITGDVHLVLGDYSSLTIQKGMNFTLDDNTYKSIWFGNLTIYAQSMGENMGNLSTTGTEYYLASIAGEVITINGGNITATTDSGGYYNIFGATVTINGGNITSKNIQGGGWGICGQNDVTINGGNVVAIATGNSGGIRAVGSGTVTINSGNVIATGNNYAGISAGVVTINGGNVIAGDTGESDAEFSVGILGTVAINGGTVNASGNTAGIVSYTFTTENDGNAFIIASSIKQLIAGEPDSSGVPVYSYNDDYLLTDDHSGIIFNDSTTKNGKVYGNPTLDTDATIPSGYTLMIDSGKTLTINADVVLTNNGKIDGSGSLALNTVGIIDTRAGDITDTVKVTGIAVTASPATTTVNEGEQVSFTATAGTNYKSTPLTYAWEKSTDDGGNWEIISEATAATYTISSAVGSDAGKYRYVVTTENKSGESEPVTLTVIVSSPPASPSHDDSSTGTSIWLTETPTPTPTETATPTETDTVPTEIPTTQPPEDEKDGEDTVPIWLIISGVVIVVLIIGGIWFVVTKRKK